MKTCLALVALVSGAAIAQVANMPAARVHVKFQGPNNDIPVKFSSKLSHVVELNFTLGNDHLPGKRIIAATLDRVAKSYGVGITSAFTVKHITGANEGSEEGSVPNFTLQDLLAGSVIVANNVGSFGATALEGHAAIQRAVEAEGRGYLAFHGSGDNKDKAWPWYISTLHPMSYEGHGTRTVAPVYRHQATAQHLILQGILETKTTPAQVPDELTPAGNEAYKDGVPTRGMRNEWYKFGRDISRDPAFADKVTILLKYDARQLGQDALPTQFRRKGGNMYTYLYQVGKAQTSYIPAGHQNDELLDPSTGFDGGSGDFDRYVAQTLFFLAGYTSSVCDASCNGLPIVDAKNLLTGKTYIHTTGVAAIVRSDVHFDPARPAFSWPHAGAFQARLLDMSGRIIAARSGKGISWVEFDASRLKPGIHVLQVRSGKTVQTRRYFVGRP